MPWSGEWIMHLSLSISGSSLSAYSPLENKSPCNSCSCYVTSLILCSALSQLRSFVATICSYSSFYPRYLERICSSLLTIIHSLEFSLLLSSLSSSLALSSYLSVSCYNIFASSCSTSNLRLRVSILLTMVDIACRNHY